MSFSRFCAISLLAALSCGILTAQAVPDSQNPPAAATSSAETSGEIVAVIEGEEYTAEEIEWIRKNIPPEFGRQVAHMTYGGFLEALALQIAVAKRAEEMKLAEKEPYRTRLEINERIFLTHAYMSEIQQVLNLTQDDYRQFYEDHKDEYQDVRISAISIEYSLNPEKAAPKDGKKPLSEKEAWVRAEELLVELRQGGDFAEMARQHSSDPSAAEKGGDMGFFRRDSRVLPDALKGPIFALKDSEFSAPVKHGGRYYIFTVTERRTLSYTEALSDILRRIQNVKITEKLDEIRQQMHLDIKDEAFAASRPAASTSDGAAPQP